MASQPALHLCSEVPALNYLCTKAKCFHLFGWTLIDKLVKYIKLKICGCLKNE